jgi:hypothetical protein
MDEDRRRQLRVAFVQADGAAIVDAIRAIDLERYLQFAGDALLIALGQRLDDAIELAAHCGTALRARGWEGDTELAEELEAARGLATNPGLIELAVDLEELADSLEGELGADEARIDLQTGEVWPAAALDYPEEPGEREPDDDDDDRWLWVPPAGSADGYRDMEDFIVSIRDQTVADLLGVAIDGRGAFRRFKDTLARWPEQEDDWYRFSDERRRGRARAWLADAGYRPTVPDKARSSD